MNRFQRIYQIGCIACWHFCWYTPCQAHHLNLDQHAGQKRLGDDHTIGLCPWHHQGEPMERFTQDECASLFGPSMKHEPVRFREVFGDDEFLLAKQNVLIRRAESLNVRNIA